MRAEDGEEEDEEGDDEREAPAEEEGRAARIPSGGGVKAVRRENAIGFGFGVGFGYGVLAGIGMLGGGASERSGEDAKRSDSLSSKEEVALEG